MTTIAIVPCLYLNATNYTMLDDAIHFLSVENIRRNPVLIVQLTSVDLEKVER